MDYMWTEEVAEAAGISPRSVTFYASQTKRKIAAGKVTDADLPLPVDRVTRLIEVKGGSRVIRSPRWDRTAVEFWLSCRKGPGGRPRTGQPAAV
jgi:hypothetical protein